MKFAKLKGHDGTPVTFIPTMIVGWTEGRGSASGFTSVFDVSGEEWHIKNTCEEVEAEMGRALENWGKE